MANTVWFGDLVAILTVVTFVYCVEPTFDAPSVNVTAVAGQTAILPCSISDLGDYNMAWVDPHQIPVTINNMLITIDARFGVNRPTPTEWNLKIMDVKPRDGGQYQCTITTQPPIFKTVNLIVQEPPQIIYELYSSAHNVIKGSSITLMCSVIGVPEPEVTWYQRPANGDDGDRVSMGSSMEINMIGNNPNVYLHEYVVSHVNSDTVYDCVAENGVKSAVMKSTQVQVYNPVYITANAGSIAVLPCELEYDVDSVITWLDQDNVALTYDNLRITDDPRISVSKKEWSLRITNVRPDDEGQYRCTHTTQLLNRRTFVYLIVVEPSETSWLSWILGSLGWN